jgi:succinoglycan biosynthesis protein ExoA
MRNEERFIGACLTALIAQDYPGHMEVLVVDGMSDDQSRTIARRFAGSYPCIRILDNAKLVTPAAMNTGVRHATGDVIVRIDGHTIPAADYVRRCVQSLERTGAGTVGGLQRHVGHSYVGRAIALTIRSPLAVGDSRFHYAQEAGEVDTVYLGAFPREVFETVGCYNEDLLRNQDYEFNYRIRQAGLAVYLDPRIRSSYMTRATLRSFCRQRFEYGYWKVEMLKRHPASLRWRQLVPPTFVATLVISGVLAPLLRPAAILLRLVLGAYTTVAVAYAFVTARKHGWRYLPAIPVILAALHVSWGLGFLYGLLRLAAKPEGTADA